MKNLLFASLGISAALLAPLAAAQVTFYEQEGFRGRTFTTNGPINNLDHSGFNDRASSAIVDRGNWQVCEDSDFRGQCIVLRPGQYPSLGAMGMNNRISSVRRVAAADRSYAYAPPPPVAPAPYPYYPHHGERLYPADVVAVRAVMGPPEQRCWVEQQQVSRSEPAEHSRARSSAASSAACSATRSAAGAATTSRRRSARSAAPRSAPTSIAADRPTRRTCSAARARRGQDRSRTGT